MSNREKLKNVAESLAVLFALYLAVKVINMFI